MRENYPSDISREQFEKIRFQLETFRKQTRPRTVDLYDVFCAILYVLKTACQWRMLPNDFPNWRTVYEYFRIWSNRKDGENKSLLEALLTEIVGDLRLIDGRLQKTSFVIIDAQSVKNSDTAEEKGYDGGKKVSGIKRHIAVDTQGLPHAIHITKANITDREGALEAFKGASSSLSNVVNVLADGGYTGETFSNKVKEIIGADVEIAKRNELHTFEVIPKRWVVERSFAWLEKCRRLWKNCERKLETSLQMVNLAFLSLLLKRY
jgi:transposase